MKQSESIKALAVALAKAQSEMPVVAFDSTNPFLHNRYASLGAVIEVSRPILGKHGLAISQFPTSDGDMIGIESMLMHESGEWISDRILMSIGDEKGKSRAQVVGSVQTYLKRYSWASICGIYADEDTDGNHPTAPAPAKAPQSAPVKPQAPPPTQRTIPKRDAPIADDETRKRMILQLQDIGEQAWNYFVAKQMLLETETLDKLPLEFVPTTKFAFLELRKTIEAHAQASDDQIPDLEFPPNEPEPQEPPTGEEDVDSPNAAWRSFPLPYDSAKWKVAKGTPLGELPPNYKYGLWANVKVETEYNGKPLSPERIAANKAFRAALDDLGRHMQFK